jgi:aminopeptidase N
VSLRFRHAACVFALAAAGCGRARVEPADPAARDLHSYARPEQARVRHVDLDLDVLFAGKTLSGAATLTIERASGSTLALDTRDLRIDKVECSPDGKTWTAAK